MAILSDFHIIKPATSIRVRRVVDLHTTYGPIKLVSFDGIPEGKDHVAWVFGPVLDCCEPPLVRVHSECLTGDRFGSMHCDCGAQFDEAIRRCTEECGVIIYMRDEGRGIGLNAKLDAYALQASGLDTFEANAALGLPSDCRDFAIAADMLKALGITAVRLLTNNPTKVESLLAAGISVKATIPTRVYVTPENRRYLEAKRRVTQHSICLGQELEQSQ
jgi:GTP cyclohydrolase II